MQSFLPSCCPPMSVEFSMDSKPEAAAIGSVRPRAGPDLTAECWFSTGRVIEPLQLVWRSVTYKDLEKGIQVWRPVRESNPCRRREREAIYRNSKETCGMDSTVRNSKDSLLDP